MSEKSPENAVGGWAAEEFNPWPSSSPERSAAACASLRDRPSVFAIDVDADGARIRSRPEVPIAPSLAWRAQIYERFINTALRGTRLPSTVLLIDVADEAEEYSEFPVLSFQRRIGSRNPLLPDLDTIEWNFYADWGIDDTQPYRDKHDSAIFVGSTTGQYPIRHVDLAHPFPRLRAFRAFRDVPAIHFVLPNIVQTEDDTVTEALRREGLGGPGVQWRDQVLHKMVISMDGNGAALSRPFIGLATNCALVKYSSNYEAWYFRKLEPGRHYLPVDTDDDVLRLIDGDMARHETVARAGRVFVDNYLTPKTYAAYMQSIVCHLSRIVG